LGDLEGEEKKGGKEEVGRWEGEAGRKVKVKGGGQSLKRGKKGFAKRKGKEGGGVERLGKTLTSPRLAGSAPPSISRESAESILGRACPGMPERLFDLKGKGGKMLVAAAATWWGLSRQNV